MTKLYYVQILSVKMHYSNKIIIPALQIPTYDEPGCVREGRVE